MVLCGWDTDMDIRNHVTNVENDQQQSPCPYPWTSIDWRRNCSWRGGHDLLRKSVSRRYSMPESNCQEATVSCLCACLPIYHTFIQTSFRSSPALFHRRKDPAKSHVKVRLRHSSERCHACAYTSRGVETSAEAAASKRGQTFAVSSYSFSPLGRRFP